MKKRIVWILVAAMSFTSVSSSALVVNGAEILDFTDEGDTTSEDSDAQSEAVELEEENDNEEENDFTSGEKEDSQKEIFDSLVESAGTDENTKKSIKEIKAETSEIFAEPIWGSFPTKDQLLAHLYVDVIYEDGTTETVQGYGTTSQGDAMQIDFSGVEFNRGHAQKGEYKVPITIGDKTIEITVDVDTVAGYCDRKAPLLTVDKAYSSHIAHQWQKAYFKFTAPEDGCYAFQCESSNDEEIVLGCMNANAQYLGNVVELKKGETVYLDATNYSETSVDFHIVPKKSYMIKDMELISSPKTEYVKGLDYSWNDYLDESKLDLKDLKVKVKYTDGNEEELGIDTIGRDDRKLQISIDYDWEIGNVINIKLDARKIQIPLTNITLAEYLEKNSQNIETFSENETRKVEWNGWSGYIYKFVPSETSNYIYKIEDEEDLTERIYGYILDENGERIKNVDYDYITELEAGKTYYLLAIPCESVKGSSKIRFFKERKIQSIDLDTKELVTYGNKIDDMYEQNIRDLVNESGIILKFTDGSEEKVKLGDTTPEGYTVDIEIPDIDFKEYYKYNAQGSYVLKLTAGDCSAEYTLKVLPEIEHLKQIAQEIKFNQKTQITIPKYSQGIYSMTVPETGYYNVECEENNSDLHITYLNENGESEDKRIQIEKNHKLFIVINNYSTDESVTTGITVKTLGEELVRVYLKQYPKNTTYIQKVDGELEDEEGVSYTESKFTEGVVITAEYGNGKTEDISFGEKNRFDGKLYWGINWDYGEQDYPDDPSDYENSRAVSVYYGIDGIDTEAVSLKWLSLTDYISENSKSFSELAVNNSIRLNVDTTKSHCQIFNFMPKKDGTHTISIDTETYTDVYIYDDFGTCVKHITGGNNKEYCNMKRETQYHIVIETHYNSETGKLRVSDDGSTVDDTEIVTPEPTATPKPTETPKPTATPKPTETPKPTATPEPTATPKPTATPEPTATPKPTATPEPTATPKPNATPALPTGKFAVKLSATTVAYNGKTQIPSVTITYKGKKLSNKYYTVKCTNNKNIGTATVTVTGKGTYKKCSGKATFKIVLKTGTVSSLKAGKKYITLNWKTVTGSTGYQIQYSTSKNFAKAKTVKIAGAGKHSTTIKKLTSKKTYYVRVRAYKTVNKKTVYGAWSASKKIVVK